MRTLIFLCVLLSSASAMAEIYRDIGPLDTLGDIKSKFPKATFERVNPAWAQKTDVMLKIRGEGMSGIIVVKFDDLRPTWKEMIEKNPTAENADFLRKIAEQSDDEAITVSWVRWVPNEPIPVQRFVSKYGPPEKSGFADEDYQPYRHWEKKGVSAYLSDNEKDVVRVDFSFTIDEYRSAYLKKYKFVPPWLKQSPKPKEQSKSSAKGAM